MSGTQGSKIKKVNMFGIYSHYISPMDFNSNGNSSLVEQFGLWKCCSRQKKRKKKEKKNLFLLFNNVIYISIGQIAIWNSE